MLLISHVQNMCAANTIIIVYNLMQWHFHSSTSVLTIVYLPSQSMWADRESNRETEREREKTTTKYMCYDNINIWKGRFSNSIHQSDADDSDKWLIFYFVFSMMVFCSCCLVVLAPNFCFEYLFDWFTSILKSNKFVAFVPDIRQLNPTSIDRLHMSITWFIFIYLSCIYIYAFTAISCEHIEHWTW